MSLVRKLQTETAISILELAEENPALVLIEPEKFDEFYAELEREVRAFVPDLTTETGRKKVGSLAYRITRRKTAIDEAGKDLTEAKRSEIAKIDKARKSIRDRMDALRDEARQPLTDWEKAEDARVAARKRDMDELKAAGVIEPGETIADLSDRIAKIEAMSIERETFRDFYEIAQERRDSAIAALRSGIARIEQAERDRAELGALRAERAERDRIEAEQAERNRVERERIEAEEREREEREASARAEADRLRREQEEREAAEKAELERIAKAEEAARLAAEEKAARELAEQEERHAAELRRIQEDAEQKERDRLADLERERIEREAEEYRRRKEAEETERRQAIVRHRAKTIGEAVSALMQAAEVDEQTAKRVIVAIAAGNVSHASIQF